MVLKLLPPVTSGEVEKSADNGIGEFGYSWVDDRVREFFSKYQHASMFQSFAESVEMLEDNIMNGIVSL